MSFYSTRPPAPKPPGGLSQDTLKFRLDGLSATRRTAYALGDAQGLSIHIWHDGKRPGSPLGIKKFCIHLDGDNHFPHKAWSLDDGSPNDHFCGHQPNRLIYQLNRVAWEGLRSFPYSQPEFANKIQITIQEANLLCIACSRVIADGYSLLRSTCCSRVCSLRFRRSQLEIRIPELMCDYLASLVILESLYFAVLCGHLNLLPPRPPELNEAIILTLLNNLQTLLKAFEPVPIDSSGAMTRRYRRRFDTFWTRNNLLLLSWAFTSYRGCLLTAPSHLLLKELRNTLPGSGYFFLINAKPEIEKAFADRLAPTGGGSAIVFHGTTFDRVYPILCEGLRTQTRPGMMQTGNVFGTGIYTASKSTVAFGYATRGQFSQPVPALQGKRINFQRVVLLVCELVQPSQHKMSDRDTVSQQPCDIYVTTNPADLIVRGLIMVKPGLPLPDIDAWAAHMLIRRARYS